MFKDDFTEILSAEFSSNFVNWLKTVYPQDPSKKEENLSDTDPKGQYFKTKKKEDKKEFAKFTKDIFNLKTPEYMSFKNYFSQAKEPIKYFSLFFDIVIKIIIRERGAKEPLLKLDEYYNILSSNFQNSFIQAIQALPSESKISINQTIETKIENSSFTEQSYERKLSINYGTFDFISESIINNNKLANWINLEFWSDFYSDDYLYDNRMKFSLRNLILIIKMLESRKERYEKMGIKIKN